MDVLGELILGRVNEGVPHAQLARHDHGVIPATLAGCNGAVRYDPTGADVANFHQHRGSHLVGVGQKADTSERSASSARRLNRFEVGD
jgi:hypothetical protein